MKRSNAYEGRLTTMATILLAWELGGGLGHFMNLRPVAEGLARRGHRVVAVLRDLTSARRFLPNPGISFLQAPFKHQHLRDLEPTCTFAQILYICGFGNGEELATLAEACAICSSTSNLT